MIKQSLLSYATCVRSRQRLLVLYSWPMMVGMIAAVRGVPHPFLAIKSFIAMSAIAFAVYIYNDIRDLEEDKISAESGDHYHVNRPLVNGRVSEKTAFSFVLVMAFIGLGISLTINLEFLGLLFASLVLGILYSTPPIQLKKRFLLKQLTIGLGGVIAGLAGGAAVGIVSKPVIYAALLFFTLNCGLNPIVDLRDIHGDKEAGCKTFPLVLGPKNTIKIGLATTIVTSILTVLSYAWIGFNFIFPIIAASSLLILGFLAYRVFNNWDKPDYIENTFIKKGMPIFFILQISVIIGVLPI